MTPSQRAELVERVAKEICREKCAFYGEPPCWDLGDEYVQETWPPDCGEPGCFALATAAIDLIWSEVLEEAAKECAYHWTPKECAAAIRALKETKDGR